MTKYNMETRRKWRRKNHLNQYCLTVEQYDEILYKQNGCCVICGKKETAKNRWGVKRLSVDHNHLTGKTRGLLCNKCNIALGFLEADKGIDLLLKAMEYIRRNDE